MLLKVFKNSVSYFFRRALIGSRKMVRRALGLCVYLRRYVASAWSLNPDSGGILITLHLLLSLWGGDKGGDRFFLSTPLGVALYLPCRLVPALDGAGGGFIAFARPRRRYRSPYSRRTFFDTSAVRGGVFLSYAPSHVNSYALHLYKLFG